MNIISKVGPAIVFCWGVIQYLINQKSQAETRRIEATRPFLDRQLMLYTEATKAAAILATSVKSDEIEVAKDRFWALYWGELALVEDIRVESAMVKFGDEFKNLGHGEHLRYLALKLAHGCRDSLAESWGVRFWRNPHNFNVSNDSKD